MSDLLERLGAYWSSLSRRDRRLLVVMVTAIALFVGYLAVSTVRSRVGRLEEAVADKERDLETIQRITGRLEESRATMAEIEARLAQYKDFSVSGFLENAGEDLKLSENIKGINDQGLVQGDFFDEHRYEVVMRKVTLEQLVNYLYKIQSAEQPLRIDRLVVRTNTRNREELNVNVEVVFSKLKEDG